MSVGCPWPEPSGAMSDAMSTTPQRLPVDSSVPALGRLSRMRPARRAGACAMTSGWPWRTAGSSRPSMPASSAGGGSWPITTRGPCRVAPSRARPRNVATALDLAAEILGKAQAPLVLGLTRTSNEAVAAALTLADRLGAVVDVGEAAVANRQPPCDPADRTCLGDARRGEEPCRCGGVLGGRSPRDASRHWERYSVEPRGRFVPEGRDGRSRDRGRYRVDGDRRVCRLFVPINEPTQFETLWTLRRPGPRPHARSRPRGAGDGEEPW